MKVLLICPDFPPVVNSAARLFSELGESLSEMSHEVTVVTRRGGVRRSQLLFSTDSSGPIQVIRTRMLPLSKRLPMMRAVEHFWMAFIFLFTSLLLPRHDAIIVYSPPLPLGLTGWILSRRWHGTFILNVQDLYPRTAVDLNLLRSRILIRWAESIERFLYSRSNAITVHSTGNREHVIRVGATPEKVYTVANWIDLKLFCPGPQQNTWRAINGLDNHFVVSFAGTMGFAQGLEDIVDAAEQLRSHDRIAFVFAGDGVLHTQLKRRAASKQLSNVHFLPFQHGNAYLELLQASDVCLVTLDKNLKTPVVPGKLQSIMAVGRPVICVADPATDARLIVDKAQCGYFIPAGDITGIAKSILRLYDNPKLAKLNGERGRVYSEVHFDRDSSTGVYNSLINSLQTIPDQEQDVRDA